jgi:hypothetical protein
MKARGYREIEKDINSERVRTAKLREEVKQLREQMETI